MIVVIIIVSPTGHEVYLNIAGDREFTNCLKVAHLLFGELFSVSSFFYWAKPFPLELSSTVLILASGAAQIKSV